jgi:hypothetical protein
MFLESLHPLLQCIDWRDSKERGSDKELNSNSRITFMVQIDGKIIHAKTLQKSVPY